MSALYVHYSTSQEKESTCCIHATVILQFALFLVAIRSAKCFWEAVTSLRIPPVLMKISVVNQAISVDSIAQCIWVENPCIHVV